MAKTSNNNAPKKETSKKKPPLTNSPEAQEQRLINLAIKESERRLIDGTASSQLIIHYLKLATQKEALEREKLKAETEMAKAKIEVMQSQKHSEELYENAMKAFKSYGGYVNIEDDYSEDGDYYED